MAKQRHISLTIFAFCSVLSARIAFYERPQELTAAEERWGVTKKNDDALGMLHGLRYYIYGIGVVGLLVFAEDYVSDTLKKKKPNQPPEPTRPCGPSGSS